MNDLIGDPAIAGQVDTRRIAALGHSLGGWTVMELAGARFDAGRFQTDCKSHPALAGCKLIPALGINRPESSAPLRESQREPLIKAVVSLDLGLARGFTPESLAQLNVPVLILSAQADSDELPAGWSPAICNTTFRRRSSRHKALRAQPTLVLCNSASPARKH